MNKNRENLKWVLIPGFIYLLGTLFGCNVPTAVAPRDEVTVTPLKKFKLKNSTDNEPNVQFVNNRLFLWKEDQQPEEASKVIWIDHWLDENSQVAAELNAQCAELESQLGEVPADLTKKNADLKSFEKSIGKKSEELRKIGALIDSLNQSISRVGELQPSELDRVKHLRNQLKENEEKQLSVQKEIVQLNADKNHLESEVSQLKRDPNVIKLEELERKRSKTQKEAEEKINELESLVEWYELPPKSFSFAIEKDGHLSASIEEWTVDKNGQPMNFSSNPEDGTQPTIVNLQYQELGGILSFDVLVYTNSDPSQRLEESYSFKLSRTKYDSKDGKMYFSGKFTRARFNLDGTSEVRDGFAKLVDKYN